MMFPKAIIAFALSLVLVPLAPNTIGQEGSINRPDPLQSEIFLPEKVAEHDLVVVYLETNAQFARVRARRNLFDTVQLVEVKTIRSERRGWAFTGPPGRYLVEIDIFDPQTGIAYESGVVTITGEEPTPPDPDNPDPPEPEPTDCSSVPEDDFGNIGKRVCKWTYDLVPTDVQTEYRVRFAENIESTMSKLAAGGIITIEAALAEIRDRNKEMMGSEYDLWDDWKDKVYEDFNERWPMNRNEFIEYQRAIAKGLKGGQ